MGKTSLLQLFLIFSTSFLLSIQAKSQTTIWSEDFSSYSASSGVQGSGIINIGDYPGSVTKWTIDASGTNLKDQNDYFKVINGSFRGRDVNGVAIWLSESIDISTYEDILVSADFWKAGGGMEPNDSINFYYSLNGGSWNSIALLFDDFSSTAQSHSISNLNGVSLQLKVEIILPDGAGQANAEVYAFDNVIVQGTLTSPPSCTTPTSPGDTETDFALDGVLTWNTALTATGYYLYFGTDVAATNIANGTDLGNATTYTPSTSLDALTDYYWKVVPYNSYGVATGCSIWTFTTEDISYCIPTYTVGAQQYGDYISLVQLGDINNSTGASSSPYYIFYNTLSTDLSIDNTYTITLRAGTYSSGNNISVWIDYDQNGDFSASEKLGNVTLFASPNEGTINFTVPSGSTPGVKRMRVREVWNNTNIDACANYNYGETEDYTVNILSACNDATLSLNSANSIQSLCDGEAITDIEYAVGGDATGSNVSGLPAGVIGTYNNGVFTIAGTSLEQGTFNYTVTTTGTPSGCSEANSGGTITVHSLPNAPTAINNTSTYSGELQSASATVETGETVDWFTSEFGNTTAVAPSGTNVGTYTAWAEARNTTTGCVSANRIEVTLVIGKKDLQVTAIAPDIIYGGAGPPVTIQYSGFVGSDDVSVIDDNGFIVGTDYTQGDPAGIYNTTILSGSATDNNYNFTPLNSSTFLVDKKDLTITAEDQTVVYGTHIGTITQNGTYTIVGFINGDNSSVISGLSSISYTTTYTENTNVGAAGITITPVTTGLSADNYSFITVSGTINISLANQYITFGTFPFTLPLNSFDTVPITVTSSSGLPVTITLEPGSAATLNYDAGLNPPYFLTNIGATGFVTLHATQAGDANFNEASPASQTFDVTKSNQTISFPAIDDLTYSNGLTQSLQAVASSGLSVTYSVESGPATVSGNILTITGAGEVWVRADQSGNVSYNEAISVLQSFTVSKGTQTITINVQDGALSSSTQITASSTSGLSVTLTLGTGSAATSLDYNAVGGYYTLSGIAGSGNIYIVGNQSGNDDFTVAPQVIQTLVIGKTNQTIDFNSIADQIYSPSLAVTLSATASSALPVSFFVISGPATLVGNMLTITGAGTVTVEAIQAGDGTYNPAPDVTQQFEVGKANPVITQADISKNFGDVAFTITPGSTSGGTFSFISGNDEIFTMSGNTATITGAGSTTLDIVQQPTANYYGITKTVVFSVGKTASTISVTGPTSYTYNGAHQGPESSSVTGSTGTVTYGYTGTGSTTYGPSSTKPINAGTYSATATVAEDDNFSGATSSPYDFTISKADATINLTSYSVDYDGNVHTAAGSAEGVLNENLAGLDLSGTSHINAGTYNTDTWTFTDVTGNYNNDSGTITNSVNPVALLITASDQTKCYGETFTFHGTEFASTGLVNAESIGSVTLTSSGADFGALPGTYVITPSMASGENFTPSNYTITYIDGEMLVNPAPTLTNVTQDITVCEGTSATIKLNGLVPGSDFTLEYTIDDVAQTPVTGLSADGFGDSEFLTRLLNNTDQGEILQVTGITITSVFPNCSKSFTQNLILSVTPLPTLLDATQVLAVCEGSVASINLSGVVPGTTFSLAYTIAGGDTTIATGITADGLGNSVFTTSVLSSANNGDTLKIIEIEDETSGCLQQFSQKVVLEVDLPSVGGTASAFDAVLCASSSTSIVLTSYTGSDIQWQESADGITAWVNVNGGIGDTTATYVTPELTATTYYRAVVTNGACTPTNSSVVSVAVNSLPTLSSVSQASAVCDGSPVTINLNGLLSNITFTLDYSLNGGVTRTVSNLVADGTGNSSFTIEDLTAANNGQSLQIAEIVNVSTGCVQKFNQSINLVINSIPSIVTTGTIDASCFNNISETTNLLYSSVTGNPISYSIDWDNVANTAGLADQGTTAFTFSTGGGSISGIVITENTPDGTYSGTMTIINAGGCIQTQAVVLTVNPLPTTPTASSNSPVCQGSTLQLNTPTVSGASYSWTGPNGFNSTNQNPIISGTWTGNSGTYYVTVTVNGCTSVVGSTDAVIDATTQGGWIQPANYDPICEGNSIPLLTLKNYTGNILRWERRLNSGNWEDMENAGSFTYSETPGSGGTWDYRVLVQNGSCAVAYSTPISVSVNQALSITLGSDPEVCQNTTTVSLSYSATTGSPNGWSLVFDATSISAGFFSPQNGLVNPAPGNISINVPYSVATGTYNGVLTVFTYYPSCTSVDYPVAVTVIEGTPVSVSIAGNNTVCAGSSETYTATPTNGGSSPSYQWKVNGSNVGTNSDVYTYVPLDGDKITCVLSSDISCAIGSPATSNEITITENILPTITLVSASAGTCYGDNSATLTYTGTTENPDKYTIDFDASAEAEGFVDVVNANLSGGVITVVVPVGAVSSTYDATLIVKNESINCESTSYAITIEINELPNTGEIIPD